MQKLLSGLAGFVYFVFTFTKISKFTDNPQPLGFLHFALPPFVNRVGGLQGGLHAKILVNCLITNRFGFGDKYIFGNYVEFHFVIGFYYI